MRSFTKYGLLAAALTSLAVGGAISVASAAESGGAPSSAPTAPAGQGRDAPFAHRDSYAHRGLHGRATRWHRGRESGVAGVFLRQIRALDLSRAQRRQIRGMLEQARRSRAAARSRPFDLAVIADPGNPGYARAVAAAKTQAVDRIERRSELATQIYQVLTPAQRHDLATLLAADDIRLEARRARMQQMRAQMQKQRAQWQRHGSATGPAASPQG